MDPPVCDPTAPGHIPAATAAADPLLDPPGVCAKSHGFRVPAGSKHAYSVVTVFPRIPAPASRSLATTVGVY